MGASGALTNSSLAPSKAEEDCRPGTNIQHILEQNLAALDEMRADTLELLDQVRQHGCICPTRDWIIGFNFLVAHKGRLTAQIMRAMADVTHESALGRTKHAVSEIVESEERMADLLHHQLHLIINKPKDDSRSEDRGLAAKPGRATRGGTARPILSAT